MLQINEKHPQFPLNAEQARQRFSRLYVPVWAWVLTSSWKYSLHEVLSSVHGRVLNTRVACGLRRHFVRPAMLFGNFWLTFTLLVYSTVLKNAQLAIKQVPFKRTQTARNDLLTTMIPFAGNKMQKLFLVTLRHRLCCVSLIMRPSTFVISLYLALGAILVWDPWLMVKVLKKPK